MGISGGSSSSNPVDMTPKSFKGLQGPYAAVIGQLLGYNLMGANGQPVNPVNFSYPAGQFASGPQSSSQQQYQPWNGVQGSNLYQPTGGGYYTGSHGNNSQGGMYISNPGMGTGNPNDILSGVPFYQGNLTAPLGSNEQSLLNQLMQTAGGTGQGSSGGTDAATSQYLQNLVNGQYLPGDQGTSGLGQFNQDVNNAHATAAYDPNNENPFLQAAIQAAQRPTLQGLTETLTRDLPGRFTQAGQFVQPQGSSAFDRAAAIATRGASDTMGDIATNMSYQGFNDAANRAFQANQQARGAEDTSMQAQLARQNQNQQSGLDRQVQGAQIAPQVTQAQVGNLVNNLQAQALPRLIQEYGIERGMDEFNNRMNGLLSVLGIAGGVTQPTVSQQSSSSQMGLSLK